MAKFVVGNKYIHKFGGVYFCAGFNEAGDKTLLEKDGKVYQEPVECQRNYEEYKGPRLLHERVVAWIKRGNEDPMVCVVSKRYMETTRSNWRALGYKVLKEEPTFVEI